MPDNFVTTKIRPIRKLFIINPNDFETFFEITTVLMCEIDGINNLILQDHKETYNTTTSEFINTFDPDVIINFSDADDEFLSEFFNTETFNSSQKGFNLHKFGSPLFTFTGKPYLLSKDPLLMPKNVFANSEINSSAKSLFHSLNYGFIGKKDYVQLKRSPSIFQDVQINCINNITKSEIDLFNLDTKFNNLSNRIGGAYSSGGSIYAINYNKNRYFDDGEHFFISSHANLDFILYFWNTRCTYSMSKLAWIPLELLTEFNHLINKDSIIVYHSEIEKLKIEKEHPKSTYILASKYFFHGGKERWIHFEHDHYVSLNNDSAMITHPNEKTFSDIGFGGGYSFEIRGLPEFIHPKNHHLGILYNDRPQDRDMFPEYFTRLSHKGVSKYFSHFSPYDTSGITQSFKLPTFKKLLVKQFKSHGFDIKETPKTFILEQLIKLIKGVSESHLICDEKIFNLIIELTPHTRTENLIRKVLPEIHETSHKDDIIAHIGRLKEHGEIITPSTTLTMEDIVSKLKIKVSSDVAYQEKLQLLYDNKIILRGKYFKCEHCSTNIWLPLENLERLNFCIECGNAVNIPIFANGRVQGDYYKLNQLVSRAVDQGQLSTLLLLSYLKKQQYRNFEHISNHEIFKDKALISDIDLCVKIGRKIGICECKSHSAFSESQLTEIIEISKAIKCDFIILSCLLEKNDGRIKETVKRVKETNIKIPVFILTKKELFSESHQVIYKYFEVESRSNEFPHGPIVIGG